MDEENEQIHTGKVIPPRRKVKASGPLDALNALQDVVAGVRECFLVHEEESTKRARIQAYEKTEVARIKAGEAVLKDYLGSVFHERRETIDELFVRFDQAVEDGDGERAQAALLGVVDLAKSSPLADLGDLGEIRKALDDPDQVWDL